MNIDQSINNLSVIMLITQHSKLPRDILVNRILAEL